MINRIAMIVFFGLFALKSFGWVFPYIDLVLGIAAAVVCVILIVGEPKNG